MIEDKKTRQDFLKLIIIYSCVFTMALNAVRIITKAAFNNYEVTLYYNNYGEGFYEVITLYVILFLGVYLFFAFYKLHQQLDFLRRANQIMKERLEKR